MENSSLGRLVGVLVAPGKTFRSIAERPTWGVAFAVLVALTVATTLLFFQKMDFAEIVRQQMEAQGREMPPEAEGATGMMRGCAMAAALGIPIIFYFGVPLIFWGAFTLLGGTIDYKTSLAVTLHAMMPTAIAALLSIPVLLGRAEITVEEAQAGSILASNLGHFAPDGASPVLVALLSSVDVFSIWVIALLIVGYHLAAKVSKAKAAVTVLVIWGVGILFKVGMAALGARGGRG
ncbi:MAG: Yip1 family protein [Thermoanaerobaculia bacterium]